MVLNSSKCLSQISGFSLAVQQQHFSTCLTGVLLLLAEQASLIEDCDMVLVTVQGWGAVGAPWWPLAVQGMAVVTRGWVGIQLLLKDGAGRYGHGGEAALGHLSVVVLATWRQATATQVVFHLHLYSQFWSPIVMPAKNHKQIPIIFLSIHGLATVKPCT